MLISIFATLGVVAILKNEATTNQAIAGLVVDEKKIDNEYLYYVLKNKREYIESLGRGIAQNNINLTILKSVKIPLPPLAVQKKIVSKLKQQDARIEKLKSQLTQIELDKSIFLSNV